MSNSTNGSKAGGLSLKYALAYAEMGWCVIPIKPGTKKPPLRSWEAYQSRRPSAATLQKWFAKENGMAVVAGPVSGGLVCRDFDDMAAYDLWAAAHPEFAKALPTVATSRGRHVYCVGDEATDGIQPEKTCIVLSDGELRLRRCYTLLPPTRHPDGQHQYRWLIPPNGKLPTVNIVDAGLSECFGGVTESTESTETTEITEDHRGVPKRCRGTPSSKTMLVLTVEEALQQSLPSGKGQRHRQVFELARALKAVPEIADLDAMDPKLEGIVRRWHKLGRERGVIATPEFDDTIIDFADAWEKVRFAWGSDTLTECFQRALENDLPPSAELFDKPAYKLLVALCRELQREAGDNDIFLAVRRAGELLETDHVDAWRGLKLLKRRGILKETSQGSMKDKKASRFRYVAADLHDAANLEDDVAW